MVRCLQVLAFTARGATLPPHTFGEIFIAFVERSCRFLLEVHAGDTLYPPLEIVELTAMSISGAVRTRGTVHDRRGERVLSGSHKYLLKTSQA